MRLDLVGEKLPPFARWLQDEFEYKSQAEVAKILGLSQSYTHDLGYGRRRLNFRLALRIEKRCQETRGFKMFYIYGMLCDEIAWDIKRVRNLTFGQRYGNPAKVVRSNALS